MSTTINPNQPPYDRDNPFADEPAVGCITQLTVNTAAAEKAMRDMVIHGHGAYVTSIPETITAISARIASRVETGKAVDFRIAQYPDGSKRVQGAYQWQEGHTWGVDWRDLPLVCVDAQGNEIK